MNLSQKLQRDEETRNSHMQTNEDQNACSTLLTPLNSDTQNGYNHFFTKVQTIWGEGFRNTLYRSCSQFSTCFIRREGTWKISRTILWYHLLRSLQYPKISTCALGPCCHVLEKLRHGAQFCNQMLLTATLEQEVEKMLD